MGSFYCFELYVKDVDSNVKFSRQWSQNILNPTVLNFKEFNSSGKVCLQLFEAAHMFRDVEYCVEQASVSESIAEIFLTDF